METFKSDAAREKLALIDLPDDLKLKITDYCEDRISSHDMATIIFTVAALLEDTETKDLLLDKITEYINTYMEILNNYVAPEELIQSLMLAIAVPNTEISLDDITRKIWRTIGPIH